MLSGHGVSTSGVDFELLVVVEAVAEAIAIAISRVLGGSRPVKNASVQFSCQGSRSLIFLGNAIKGR